MQKVFFIKKVIGCASRGPFGAQLCRPQRGTTAFTCESSLSSANRITIGTMWGRSKAPWTLVRKFHLDNSRETTGNSIETISALTGTPVRVSQVEYIRYSSSIFSPTSVDRFLNFLTKKGKKSKARLLLNKTLFLLTKKSLDSRKSNMTSSASVGFVPTNDSIFILNQAISNVKPFFEVKKVRVAGTTYQVPCLVQATRQESLAIHWILESAYERKKKNPVQPFENCLAFEIYEAFQKQGQARMKRNELHKLAEVNRAFSHFRWW